MPLGWAGSQCRTRDFCHILTLLPPGASVFHKHMSCYILQIVHGERNTLAGDASSAGNNILIFLHLLLLRHVGEYIHVFNIVDDEAGGTLTDLEGVSSVVNPPLLLPSLV